MQCTRKQGFNAIHMNLRISFQVFILKEYILSTVKNHKSIKMLM